MQQTGMKCLITTHSKSVRQDLEGSSLCLAFSACRAVVSGDVDIGVAEGDDVTVPN